MKKLAHFIPTDTKSNAVTEPKYLIEIYCVAELPELAESVELQSPKKFPEPPHPPQNFPPNSSKIRTVGWSFKNCRDGIFEGNSTAQQRWLSSRI